MDKTRIYPCWALDTEEKKLSLFGSKGHYLSEVDGAVYIFREDEPDAVRYAVEYVGKKPDDPARISAAEEKGWQFVGRFGKKRYYIRPAAEDAEHPSRGSTAELERLHTVQSNLMTAILLNIPGTLYCLMFIAYFLSDGFFITDLFNPVSAPIAIGLAVGVFSLVMLFRWLAALNRRIKKVKL